MSITIQGCTITPDSVTVPKAEWDKIARVIAAAETLYEAVKQHCDAIDSPDYLTNALSDYANAKE